MYVCICVFYLVMIGKLYLFGVGSAKKFSYKFVVIASHSVWLLIDPLKCTPLESKENLQITLMILTHKMSVTFPTMPFKIVLVLYHSRLSRNWDP